MAKYEVVVADSFIEDAAALYSDTVFNQLQHFILLLETSPEIGSPRVRASLKAIYGEGIRKIALSSFLIIYRFKNNRVDVLALVYGPSVK
ncbi:MAG: type II toxin-antitoxin system RelE/ParE family toxin [Raoultibacter sp.]